MLKIKVEGMADVQRQIDAIGKRARFAAAQALNVTAFAVLREGRRQIEAAFDRPTKWTVAGWYVRNRATKADLVAAVGWSDYLANKQFRGPDYYLAQHFNGGGRQHTRFEQRLIAAGIMPDGMNAVPGKAAADLGMIDRNGNIKPGVIVAILSALSAFNTSGFTANASVRQSKRRSANKAATRQVWWAGKPGPNTPAGIWALDDKFRSGRGRLRPVVIFVQKARYRKRLDLDRIAAGVVDKVFLPEFNKQLVAALRTAK